MNKELDEALCKDFPILFKDRYAGMRETCMCWGFECGDGWEPLIRKAAEKIEALNQTLPEDQQVHATQIKEKYGTLRFYLSNYLDGAEAAATEAENASETTCEKCGKPGELRGKGWVYTACDTHTKEGDK